MENRRPLRVQRKEDILRQKTEPEKELSDISETEEESRDPSMDTFDERVPRTKEKRVSGLRVSTVMCVLLSVYTGYMWMMHRRCVQTVSQIEAASKEVQARIQELEALLASKYKEVDVADYLEGARVIYDLTTPAYEKKGWNMKITKGHSGEVAIDKVCTKGHCYSFGGSEGKLAIAFKGEKVIKKIGISHPIFDNRSSAPKKFTVDCIVNNKEERVGEFEYEIPGDSFQQFAIPSTKCTGVVLRVKTNHGHKEYTCIYKVYAFE